MSSNDFNFKTLSTLTSINKDFEFIQQLLEESVPVIGIDLGTTNCCVGTWRNGKVEIIPNNLGERITPSEVSIQKNEIAIGRNARNLSINSKNPNIKNSKRLIGRYFRDPKIQEEIKSCPVKIEEDPYTKKPQYCIKVGKEIKNYLPEDISSMILKHLKEFSETFIGEKVKKAVITVPAHFNNEQREATKLAAENAGLEVIRIINEPTAAAIAYGYIHKSEEERKVLVFDLGGGTFDVSILNIKGEEFTVLASCGENYLGGEDFDELLTKFALIQLIKKIEKKGDDDDDKEDDDNDDEEEKEQEKKDYSTEEIEKDFKDYENEINKFYDKKNKKAYNSLFKIRKEIEEIKKQLSSLSEVTYSIDVSELNNPLMLRITRETYENLCEKLWNKCYEPLDKALKLSKLTKEKIDKIVLVGGSSRTPKIQEKVKNYFHGKEALQNIHPEEVVAYGATIVASIEDLREKDKRTIKIREITSLPIGIGVKGEKMINIIPKGSELPSKNKSREFVKEFKTPENKDKDIIINVYEGDDDLSWGNHFLGKLIIKKEDIQNVNKVKIIMSLDYNSLLTVSVEINGILNKKKLEITNDNFYDDVTASVVLENNDFIKEGRKKIKDVFGD